MAKHKKPLHRSKNHKIRWTISFVFSCLVLIALACFLCYLLFFTFTNNRWIISLSAVAMIGGAIFESFRISRDWFGVGLKILVSLFLSLFSFMPGKKEDVYNFEEHFYNSFYWFLIIFVIANLIVHAEKIKPKLDEQTTFLQALAGLYWAIETGLFELEYNPFFSIAILMAIFCLYASYQAFSDKYLHNRHRFRLSLISSIIMAIFAVDYIIKVLSHNELRFSTNFTDSLLTIVDHFFLGVASLYIAQNLSMLLSFLPSEGFFQNYKEGRKEHIDRYSSKQAKTTHAIMILALGGGFYLLNYFMGLLSYSTAIWLTLLFIPLIIQIMDAFLPKQRNRY